jgi:hypothetical protein
LDCCYCSALFFPSSDFIPLDFSGKVFNEAEAIIVFYVRFWFNLQVRNLVFSYASINYDIIKQSPET